TADHGEMLGDHYLWGKNAPYEGALNIPLVIRDPSRRAAAGTVVEAFTESVDIAPTLLDWIGQPVPPGWNGRSLLPFLEGETPTHWRGHMFAEIDIGDPVGPTRFERVFGVPAEAANYAILSDGTHKYVHFNGGIAPLLFDVRHGAEGEDLAGGLKHMAELLHYSRLMLDHRMTHAHQSHARLMITDDGIRP
ncbi:MAG: sulfatase-like hydrolase/transferase, partial [Rhodobiaceae bacterium]|nr:sulfatase-like hydrolase/transferase [Rhodobiaceae bacterium]